MYSHNNRYDEQLTPLPPLSVSTPNHLGIILCWYTEKDFVQLGNIIKKLGRILLHIWDSFTEKELWFIHDAIISYSHATKELTATQMSIQKYLFATNKHKYESHK